MDWTKIGCKLAVVVAACMLPLTVEAKTQVTKQPFGKTTDGTPVEIYTLQGANAEIRIMTYGGIIQSVKIPDRKGHVADVVLGFDSLDGYEKNPGPYFGALIGRYANRIANGEFKLDGHTYTLPKNDHGNTLHGGTRGFDKVVWKAKEIPDGIELTHVSPNGDQGFPGTLTAVVKYTLTGGVLHIDYSATTDKDTVINLTNHSYWNLSGQGNGTILHDELKINATDFTPVNSKLIPTGALEPVVGTPFDFRKLTVIGSRINDDNQQLKYAGGYDFNWVLNKREKPAPALGEAAEVYDPTSGRVLTVWTTQPGIQFYTGNFLDGTIKGKDGKVYVHRGALALETQHYPDSPNQPKFPSTELKPGQRYHQVTEFRFSTR
ncbi:MAG TPA: aldose epimerase family protein [Candidatus Acidoferrum sp.]|nr:aldose epimerase family protein [Candidatus Acidoferrum sp.]